MTTKAKIAAILGIGLITGVISPDHSESSPLAGKQLKLVQIDNGKFEHVLIPFKVRNKPSGIASFEVKQDTALAINSYDLILKSNSQEVCRLKGDVGWTGFSDIGTVDLGGNGNEQIFLVADDYGMMRSTVLVLANPQICKIIWLEVRRPSEAADVVTVGMKSENYQTPSFESERSFLEEIRYDYGYVDVEKHANDPKFAYYFWKKDNGDVIDGALKIRKYKGKFPSGGSVLDTLKVGSWIYMAEFKAGVMAYNGKTDEHFVLFYPQSYYHWPTVLKNTGPYLLIGTRGEGLAVVDLNTNKLKRFRFNGPEDDVRSLNVVGSEVLINGSRKLQVKSFYEFNSLQHADAP